MPLFGPMGPAITGGGLYGVDFAALVNAFQNNLPDPRSSLYSSVLPPPAPATATGASLAPAAGASSVPPAPPPPAMQSIGTFTTRRTQLFGPLAAVAI